MLSRFLVGTMILFLMLGVGSTTSGLSMKEYLELKKKPSQTLNSYLSGLIDAFTVANNWLGSDKRLELFCPPGKLAIQTSNLQQLVEEFYNGQSPEFQTQYFDKIYSFESTAMMALVNTFPCKGSNETRR